jgi:DNA repair photolyase
MTGLSNRSVSIDLNRFRRSNVLITEIECRSLLNKSALADYCINPYVGCQHACKYCYAESYTRRFTSHTEAWGQFVDVKINAPSVLAREIKRKNKGTVYISSLTDAYQPLERKYELTRKLLEILLRHQFPISIQTKSALVLRDLDLIRKFDNREVGFTITALNNEISELFEPASSSVAEKLSAIKQLKENGVRTFVFFGPILPYLSDQNLKEYLQQIVSAGADYIYVDKLNLKPGLWTSLHLLLRKDYPQLCEKWKDILLSKNDYYEKLKPQIDAASKELKIECKFCF